MSTNVIIPGNSPRPGTVNTKTTHAFKYRQRMLYRRFDNTHYVSLTATDSWPVALEILYHHFINDFRVHGHVLCLKFLN